MDLKVNFILENFDKFATIYRENSNKNTNNPDMICDIFVYIVPLVFLDYENYELNFDNEEMKQDQGMEEEKI